jgi:cytochrome b subunit of formate dehydrogenase
MVSIIAFLSTLAGIILHYALVSSSGTGGRKGPLEVFQKSLRSLTQTIWSQRTSVWGNLKKLVYLLALVLFGILGLTGFGPTLILNQSLSGYCMIIHAVFASVFGFCLAVLGLMWGPHYCFTGDDWRWVESLFRRETANAEPRCHGCFLGQKMCFWVIIALALPLMLSIALSMFKLFGTDTQRSLMELHRYSALLLSLAVVVHTYLIVLPHVKRIAGK